MHDERVSIRTVIDRVLELHPEALEIKDTEFRKLFNAVARDEFGIEEPDSKWQLSSVERTRKKAKAEYRARESPRSVKLTAKQRLLEQCDQYEQMLRSALDIPSLLETGAKGILHDHEEARDHLKAHVQKLRALMEQQRDLAARYLKTTELPAEERRATHEELTQSAKDIEDVTLPRCESEIGRVEAVIQVVAAECTVAAYLVAPATFVYLMAMLDSFIADALRHSYRQHPQQMQRKSGPGRHTQKEIAEQKKLPYDEILACGSYDALVDLMVDREVRLVTAESIGVQFEALEACGVGLAPIDRAEVAEVVATRNIYVHNGGSINAEYLRKSEAYWSPRGGCAFSLDEPRPLDAGYISRAAELGVQIITCVRSAVW